MNRPRLLIISTVFPGRSNGASLAVLSSLKIYMRYFQDVTFVAVLDIPLEKEIATEFTSVEFVGIPCRRGSNAQRFAHTALMPWPAVTSQYVTGEARRAMTDFLSKYRAKGGPFHIVFEHLPPTVFLHQLPTSFRGCITAFRSHDVLSSAFLGLTMKRWTISSWLWHYEISRIRKLEAATLKRFDFRWTITDEDAREYAHLFGEAGCRTLGVEIEIGRYENVKAGDARTILHLGGSDVRKEHGLRRFLTEVWPEVRLMDPQFKLLLGGSGSEKLSNEREGVFGLGRVANEVEFLSRGQLFVNPQITGSGVKLKSLNAMAARKTLVTTPNGARGIAAAPGKELHICDTSEKMAKTIISAMRAPEAARAVGLAGHDFVAQHYSEAAYYAKCGPLIQDFASHSPEGGKARNSGGGNG